MYATWTKLSLLLGVLLLCTHAIRAGESGPTPLRVATFCCDLTPPLGQPIYSSYQALATVEHPLLAKGVVIDDAGQRYVLCAVDWCELCNSTHARFRQKLSEAAGTDPARVAVQTVHQHTAPMGDADASRLLEAMKNPPPFPEAKYFDEAADKLAAAVKESMQHLQPCDAIGTGQAKVERVASSRRIRLDNGTLVGRMSSCKDPAVRALPEGRIDPLLRTITFAQGTKPIARLHYYATHPQSFYGDPRASYDFPGIARETLEKEDGAMQVYFTGCGSDIAAGKYNDGSREARDELTERLLAGMRASIASTRFVPARHVVWRSVPLAIVPRDAPGYTETDVRAKMEDPKEPAVSRVYSGAMRLAFLQRVAKPIELQSLQIGDVHIVHLPGEPMIEFQLFAQQQLPDKFVAVAGYGDCGCGYVCTEASFAEGGYEPSESMMAPSAEWAVKKAIRRLLGLEPSP